MSYIPKSAQRKIDASVKLRATVGIPTSGPGTPQHAYVPRRLEQGTPGQGLYEVFFNGQRQHLCVIADMDAGFITRYTQGIGNQPSTKTTETLKGRVVIRRKGTKHVEG